LLPTFFTIQISAILGACVADAAARPLHWVYDMSDLKRYLSTKIGSTDVEKAIDRNAYPEFYPESRSPYYNVSSYVQLMLNDFFL
jgi:hypothetical protein